MNTDELLRGSLRSLEAQTNGLDPARVIAGAKRRRVRRRATTATASVAAAAAVFSVFAVADGTSSGPPFAREPGSVMPSAPVPADPEDVVVDGIRYRARYPGERLAAVRIGTAGQASVEFTATITAGTRFRPLCTSSGSHRLAITINGLDIGNSAFERSQVCSPEPVAGPREEAAFSSSDSVLLLPPSDLVGKRVRIRAFLIESNGKPVTAEDARIALGVYQGEGLRKVGDIAVPTMREFRGVPYRLAGIRTARHVQGASVSIEAPAGVPFLVSFGGDRTSLGGGATAVRVSPGGGQPTTGPSDGELAVRVSPGGREGRAVMLAGLDQEHHWIGTGLATVPQPARAEGTVTATSKDEQHPSKAAGGGLLIVALYVPA